MKIVLYNDNKEIQGVYENIVDPIVTGKNIKWKSGYLGGIIPNFIIVEDDIELSDVFDLSDEIIKKDKKNDHIKIDEKDEIKRLKDENTALKVQLESMSKDFQSFMDFYFEKLENGKGS